MKYIKEHPIKICFIIGIAIFVVDFILTGIGLIDGMIIGALGFISLFIMVVGPAMIFVFNTYKKILMPDETNEKENNVRYQVYNNYDYDFEAKCLTLLSFITDLNDEIATKYQLCLTDAKMYYQIHKDNFLKWNISEFTNNKQIEWLEMANLLLDNNYAFLINNDSNLDYFVDELRKLDKTIGFNENYLDVNGNYLNWIDSINEIWKNNNLFLLALEVKDSNYILFITTYDYAGDIYYLNNNEYDIYPKVSYEDEGVLEDEE